MSNTVVTIGAPSAQTQVSVSSADIIYVSVAAGFTGQGGGGGGGANLSTTRTATTVTVVSDSGTDATIAAADGTNAGVMTAAMKTKLDGIEAGAEVNDSASEILTKLLTVDGSGSNLDADTLDGVHASALVPYTGATGDVNLGEHGIQLGNLEFDNTPTNTPATDGSVFWDSGDGTLQLQMKGGATQKVGMNTFARIYNDSGVQLVKGDVVYISGAQGNRIAAKKAQANTESTAKNTFAIVVETIAAGAEGTVITEGPLYQLNTFGLTAGATLYLSPTTAGGYTETQPQAPDHLVIIGFVERVHATVGSIFVKIANGYELEELHDVDLTESKATPVDADALLLQDSADSSIWKRLTWANLKATAKTYFDTLYANIVHTHVIGDVTNLQTTLDGKVDENASITGATKTKITYDAKGLVTAGADATTADIADSSNKRYVTDAQLTVIGNTSGTNTGDQNLFGKVAVSGQSDVVADSTNDTLTLVAGSNITITTDASTDSITIASTGGGGGVSDGDKGDITVSSSGTVWTVDNDAITYGKIQNVSAASKLLGRGDSGSGDVEEITLGTGLTMTGTTLSASGGGGGTVLSPAQITSWQNNYNPTSWGSGVQTLRLDGNSAFNFLTGLTATTGGHRVKLMNVGNHPIGLYHESTSSTAANRFSFNIQDTIILPGRCLTLEYDGTSSRWRLADSYNIWAESLEFISRWHEDAWTDNASNIGVPAFGRFTFTSGSTTFAGSEISTYRPRNGIVELSTGTTTTGNARWTSNQNQIITFHDGTNYRGYHVWEGAFYSPSALSDATNSYIVQMGFANSATVLNGGTTNSVQLTYTHSTNSGNWVFETTNGATSVVTSDNTSTAFAINTWYRVRIVVYPDGTARAFLNGTQIGSLSSGIFTNRSTGTLMNIRKTAGTTARIIACDYQAYGTVYNEAR